MKRIIAALLVVVALSVTGCASMKMTKDTPAPHKAELVVTDIETSLAIAEGIYPALLIAAPDKAAEIKAKVDPSLAVARRSVALMRAAVDTWQATGDAVDVQDWAHMRGAAADAVGKLVVLIAEIRAQYGA